MIKESSAYFHVKNKKEDLMETADLISWKKVPGATGYMLYQKSQSQIT